MTSSFVPLALPQRRPAGPRVVVTGIGAVSGFGFGASALWRGLRRGAPAIGPFERFDHSGHRTHLAAEVPARELPESPRSARHSLADRFALAAAREALHLAGLPDDGGADGAWGGRVAGVHFGSSTGGMWESESYYAAISAAPEAAGRRASLRDLVSQPPSGPAEAVARALGTTGPVQTISSACASATLAIGRALEALRAGEVDVSLAGGADSLCRLTYAGFNALRSVDPAPCRPFRADREGLSLGEGAGVLVLEREEDALRRGATPLAVLEGAGASCDAHHMTAPDPRGSGVARAVRETLADAGEPPSAVGFWNAHGTGTPLNDAAEWAALQLVFGDAAARLPVTSTKGSVGHYLGSAGAVELVATILCLLAGEAHVTPGEGPVDPAAPVDLVLGSPRRLPAGTLAVSANFAFGGSNAALAVRAWAPPPGDGGSDADGDGDGEGGA